MVAESSSLSRGSSFPSSCSARAAGARGRAFGSRPLARLTCLVAAAVAAGVLSGCAPNSARQGQGMGVSAEAAAALQKVDRSPAELRSQVMSIADNYVTTAVQGLDHVLKTSKRREVVDWASQTRIATALASYTNATGPNEAVCLLDMVVFATLKRRALEEHWIPTLLKDEGAEVLAAYRRGEAEVWAGAARVLTSEQVKHLHNLIDQWVRDHPGQYYVAHIRFAEFAASRNITSGSPEAQLPSSVFRLLYLDPLANLDPVTREMQSYRALIERLAYMTTRMSPVIAWQAERAVQGLTAAPEVGRFVSANEVFATATTQFARTTADYPAFLTAERKAAVEQIAAATAVERSAAVKQIAGELEQQRRNLVTDLNQQRQDIVTDLNQQQGRLADLVTNVRGVVERADQAAVSANAATAQTVTTTEQATRRTLDHAFRLALTLLLVVLLGVPLVMLAYRFASRRVGRAPPT